MSKKALGVVIKLVSMANTGYFYTTMKNARLPKKLLLRKYDPVVRQHVLFKVRRYTRRVSLARDTRCLLHFGAFLMPVSGGEDQQAETVASCRPDHHDHYRHVTHLLQLKQY